MGGYTGFSRVEVDDQELQLRQRLHQSVSPLLRVVLKRRVFIFVFFFKAKGVNLFFLSP